MRVAIVGSRDLKAVDIEKHLPAETEEIVSGGAVGVDSCAAEYAKKSGIRLVEFLPQYARYGKAATIVRNKEIVDYSDKVIVFWNGSSKGALSVIQYAQKIGKAIEIVLCEKES